MDRREVSVRNLLGSSLPLPSRPMRPKDLKSASLDVFGDREVVCGASEEGLQIWFFNPDFYPKSRVRSLSFPWTRVDESGI